MGDDGHIQGHGHDAQYHQQQQQQQQQQFQLFWQQQISQAESSKEHDFKNHELPLARIKKVMKTDEDVKTMMISAEAPVLFARACEMFVLELTMRAWVHTEENKRRTLQRNDIAMAITKTDIFDFLIDIVPRDDIKPAAKKIEMGMSNYYYPPMTPFMQQQMMLRQQMVQQQLLQQQQQQQAQQQAQHVAPGLPGSISHAQMAGSSHDAHGMQAPMYPFHLNQAPQQPQYLHQFASPSLGQFAQQRHAPSSGPGAE